MNLLNFKVGIFSHRLCVFVRQFRELFHRQFRELLSGFVVFLEAGICDGKQRLRGRVSFAQFKSAAGPVENLEPILGKS
jgi:hypothetical protein